MNSRQQEVIEFTESRIKEAKEAGASDTVLLMFWAEIDSLNGKGHITPKEANRLSGLLGLDLKKYEKELALFEGGDPE